MEDDMKAYLIVASLLLLGIAVQEPARAQDVPVSEPVVAPPPGYIITPSGQLIFPSAQPPAGDTSTLSGAGPDVSEGPVVGEGPHVSTGPEVGSDLDYPKPPAADPNQPDAGMSSQPSAGMGQ
jgi:hypothetical protein